MQTDDRGYDVSGNVQRARYKLALSRALARDAINDAKALAAGAERNAWLRIARESRSDARYWVRQLREANRQLSAA